MLVPMVPAVVIVEHKLLAHIHISLGAILLTIVAESTGAATSHVLSSLDYVYQIVCLEHPEALLLGVVVLDAVGEVAATSILRVGVFVAMGVGGTERLTQLTS
jgi:hypothetical protein